MDDMLANAKITPDTFDNLKSGIQSLTDKSFKMSDISMTAATTEYAMKNVKNALSK
jgi:hypothetical protein